MQAIVLVDGGDCGRTGVTALLLAACNGHAHVIKWLLKNRALLGEHNNEGDTALLVVAWDGHTKTVQWLCRLDV